MKKLINSPENVVAESVEGFALAPAGASFEHLHKQLVAIDDLSMSAMRENDILYDFPTRQVGVYLSSLDSGDKRPFSCQVYRAAKSA